MTVNLHRRVARWRRHPLALTLAHGVDEDATYCNNLTLVRGRAPEPWRDLRATHVLRALKRRAFEREQHSSSRSSSSSPSLAAAAAPASRAPPDHGVRGGGGGGGVAGRRQRLGLDPARRTVVYVTSVGQLEFLDALAPRSLAQQTWQGLWRLRRRYNVLVSLHPLLGARGVFVSRPTPTEAVRQHPQAAVERSDLSILGLTHAMIMGTYGTSPEARVWDLGGGGARHSS